MRKYTVIAKTKDKTFVKYRTNKPEQIILFLNKKFGEIYYANFYYKMGINKGKLAGTWGKNKGFQFN